MLIPLNSSFEIKATLFFFFFVTHAVALVVFYGNVLSLFFTLLVFWEPGLLVWGRPFVFVFLLLIEVCAMVKRD